MTRRATRKTSPPFPAWRNSTPGRLGLPDLLLDCGCLLRECELPNQTCPHHWRARCVAPSNPPTRVDEFRLIIIYAPYHVWAQLRSLWALDAPCMVLLAFFIPIFYCEFAVLNMASVSAVRLGKVVSAAYGYTVGSSAASVHLLSHQHNQPRDKDLGNR